MDGGTWLRRNKKKNENVIYTMRERKFGRAMIAYILKVHIKDEETRELSKTYN